MRVLEQMGWDPRRVRMLPSFGPPRRGTPGHSASCTSATARPCTRYCLTRSDSSHEAEDLVSEVFLKSMESLARYRDQGLPFIALLYRVARNAAIDRSRRDRGSSTN